MAKYGSGSVTIYLEDAPAGTSRNISNFILEAGGLKITSATEPSTAYGDTWEEILPAGLRKGEPIDLTGHMDTDSTAGSFKMFADNVADSPSDDTQALVVAASSEKFWHSEVYVTSFEIVSQVGKIVQFKSQLVPTGACTWTTSTS